MEMEEHLGSLLHANDELVTALMTFEQLDRSIDADSDSDDDVAEQAHLYRSKFQQSISGPLTASNSLSQWHKRRQRQRKELHLPALDQQSRVWLD
jgi:hypothetical protein